MTGASMGAHGALITAAHHADLVDGVIALCPATDLRRIHAAMKSSTELMFKHIAKSLVTAYGGTPDQVPEEYAYRAAIEQVSGLTMSIVIRHGDSDPIVPVDHSRMLVSALKAQGTPVRYDELPNDDHAAPTIDAPWGEYLDFVTASRQG